MEGTGVGVEEEVGRSWEERREENFDWNIKTKI